MSGINVKTRKELEVIAEGGKKLARVKNRLEEAVRVGVSAQDLENLAVDLILSEGVEGSFKKVAGYS